MSKKLGVELLTLCDFALTSQQGKLSLIGLFDRIFVSQLPTTYSRFFLVAIVTGESETTHQLQLHLKDPNGNNLLPQKELSVSFGANNRANLLTDIANLSLSHLGEYKIELVSGSKVIDTKSFFVTQLAQKDTKSAN